MTIKNLPVSSLFLCVHFGSLLYGGQFFLFHFHLLVVVAHVVYSPRESCHRFLDLANKNFLSFPVTALQVKLVLKLADLLFFLELRHTSRQHDQEEIDNLV